MKFASAFNTALMFCSITLFADSSSTEIVTSTVLYQDTAYLKIPRELKISNCSYSNIHPVIKYNNLFHYGLIEGVTKSTTYLALSYLDNRNAIAICGFDQNGNLVNRINRSGARYINIITLDKYNKQITFIGQSNNKVSVSYSEIEALISNPYLNYAYNYKGTVHAHSTNSNFHDGLPWDMPYNDTPHDLTPQVLLSRYLAKGHTFLPITDHNYVTGESPETNALPIIHIVSMESGWLEKHHALAINIPPNMEMDKLTGGCLAIQGRIDHVISAGGMFIVAHPSSKVTEIAGVSASTGHDHGLAGDFYRHWCLPDLIDNQGYIGMEINGKDDLKWWDDVLSQGFQRRNWAFGGDDYEGAWNGLNRKWIVVNSNLGPATDFLGSINRKHQLRNDILENIERGNFYVVTRDFIEGDDPLGPDGVGIDMKITTSGRTISVDTGVHNAYGDTIRFVADCGRVVQTNKNVSQASYTMADHDTYVRVEVNDGARLHAYSQPLYNNAIKTGTVQGRFYDQNNKGVPGLTFSIAKDGCIAPYCGRHVTTDQNGEYSITLPLGKYVFGQDWDYRYGPARFEVVEGTTTQDVYYGPSDLPSAGGGGATSGGVGTVGHIGGGMVIP